MVLTCLSGLVCSIQFKTSSMSEATYEAPSYVFVTVCCVYGLQGFWTEGTASKVLRTLNKEGEHGILHGDLLKLRGSVYTYVCIHIIHIYIYTYIYIYVSIHIYIYIWYQCLHTHTFTCSYICSYIYMLIRNLDLLLSYMCAYIYIYIYICIVIFIFYIFIQGGMV